MLDCSVDMRIELQADSQIAHCHAQEKCLRPQGVGTPSPLLAFILNPLQQADDSQHNIGLR